ncbi:MULTISPECIES: glycosyltransferase [Chromobacterium]|uniref:Glycosyltransferase n=2 Tax=Chromobacterium haemolyticum TaxID=394935 RepID=A0ABS3GQX4_9NEIS|nr:MULTISPECIES: glycosyltransferase [Chromobacterium]MBK0416215.1 glycosyltransferase [Chromobacterium haemolyticum]MBO0417450.1 glycosyltransferase [Chromobacterium haemolyticum]MBO0500641.1 glycosyltransferase [Chromobacterium haemolyticum]MDH0342263.1 glycosyltransferase [Chromobacterium haemolyticum]BBH10849.1 biofilm formation protein PslH [Chromobacterium haemolyticum]
MKPGSLHRPLSLGSTGACPPLRILWTLPYLPWPTTSGGKLRQFQLLRALAARGHRITLLVQSKEPASDACRRQLESIVERLIVLPRRPLKHPLTLLAAALGPYPLLASVNGLAPDLSRTFDGLLRQRWDVVQIEHSYGLQPFLDVLGRHGQPFLLTEHNVESELGAATYQHLPRWCAPFVWWDRWRYRRWAALALNAAERVAAVTWEDAAAMAQHSGRLVDVVINGVDADAFSEVRPDYASQRLLFVGNFEYPPNRDAVVWLAEEVMPRLWRRLPRARLAICGYAMPEDWARRWPDERLEWLGFVPELSTQQRRAAAFIAGLRQGGGSKLKVLEALAAGLALLSTPQGASGLDLRPDSDYLRGDDAEQLAEAAAALLSRPERAASLGAAGREYVRRRHDWAIAADQLETLYRELRHAHRN